MGRWAGFMRSPALILSTLFVLAAGGLGSSNDFGLFVVSIPILGILLFASLAFTARAAFLSAHRRRAAAAAALICLAPLAYVSAYGAAQRIRFLVWAPAHVRQLAQASRTDGIIMGWDSWGMAGEDTYSYLVVDTQDRLGSKARSDQWTREIRQTCGLWKTQRMWPRLYVVTTYTNCPYDGVAPAA